MLLRGVLRSGSIFCVDPWCGVVRSLDYLPWFFFYRYFMIFFDIFVLYTDLYLAWLFQYYEYHISTFRKILGKLTFTTLLLTNLDFPSLFSANLCSNCLFVTFLYPSLLKCCKKSSLETSHLSISFVCLFRPFNSIQISIDVPSLFGKLDGKASFQPLRCWNNPEVASPIVVAATPRLLNSICEAISMRNHPATAFRIYEFGSKSCPTRYARISKAFEAISVSATSTVTCTATSTLFYSWLLSNVHILPLASSLATRCNKQLCLSQTQKFLLPNFLVVFGFQPCGPSSFRHVQRGAKWPA